MKRVRTIKLPPVLPRLLLALALLAVAPQLVHANWPAWSNPSLPSGDLGAGAAPLDKGQWLVSLSAMRGLGFDGGHFETKGLTESGEIITVPLHRHEISMELSDVQILGRYAFATDWFGELRVPFGVREQTAEIEPLRDANGNEPSAEDVDAMVRNGLSHHRTETYSGIGDVRLLVGRQSRSIWGDNDVLLWSAGLSLPTGKTEEDPWLLGSQGLAHNHIQLGNGTFDPLLSLQYSRPLGEDWSTIATASGRFPFYENGETFRGPVDASMSARALYQTESRWSFDGGYQLAIQGYAHWNGYRDKNTGLMSHTAELGAAKTFGGTRIRLGFLVPIATQLFLDDSDGFEPGPTLSLSFTQSGGS